MLALDMELFHSNSTHMNIVCLPCSLAPLHMACTPSAACCTMNSLLPKITQLAFALTHSHPARNSLSTGSIIDGLCLHDVAAVGQSCCTHPGSTWPCCSFLVHWVPLGINDRAPLLLLAAAVALRALAAACRTPGLPLEHVSKGVPSPLLCFCLHLRHAFLLLLACVPNQQHAQGNGRPPEEQHPVQEPPEEGCRHDGTQGHQDDDLSMCGGAELLKLTSPDGPLFPEPFSEVPNPAAYPVCLIHILGSLF
mmetsp:Transcript_13849/g.29873  ORF Transcript_13849/g.29873 Transcript_13849/m.29873 type:complete len:251 (-) Transcript_13849:521-1273(-)